MHPPSFLAFQHHLCELMLPRSFSKGHRGAGTQKQSPGAGSPKPKKPQMHCVSINAPQLTGLWGVSALLNPLLWEWEAQVANEFSDRPWAGMALPSEREGSTATTGGESCSGASGPSLTDTAPSQGPAWAGPALSAGEVSPPRRAMAAFLRNGRQAEREFLVSKPHEDSCSDTVRSLELHVWWEEWKGKTEKATEIIATGQQLQQKKFCCG
ncbi:uncharacterized protein LOC111939750 [Cyanistes caeruleus]|uniref:uncharacterized protein LOC111939750 n=1 Tax=Cyanistes caeruleus TaxID=156563 RepID=UPI000CDB2675|nr:uncharacterized protein LOC111939750 [Cyanistes caeruleus]